MKVESLGGEQTRKAVALEAVESERGADTSTLADALLGRTKLLTAMQIARAARRCTPVGITRLSHGSALNVKHCACASRFVPTSARRATSASRVYAGVAEPNASPGWGAG